MLDRPAGRMIEFRTLGALGLRRADGTEITPVLAQPKRVALLAYLALARPRGFQRRDTLLALFWPELDARHARWALNQALRYLRGELGAVALPSRGDEEVGLDFEQLRCDAVAFEEALDAGHLHEALDWYRGDLLQGFLVSDVPDFEPWLDGRRALLRDRAAQAAWALAECEESKGRRADAARWARRAAALSPYDEAAARRVVALLDRAGDRAGAVHAYEQFARRLSTDLELEPSAETVAVVEAIRARQSAAPSRDAGATNAPDQSTVARAPVLGSEESRVPSDGVQPAPAPDDDDARPSPPAAQMPVEGLPDAATHGVRSRRWTARIAVGLLVLGVIGGTAAVVRSVKDRPAAVASPTAIAVLPFVYRGSPKSSYLGEGMVDLLSAKLDGAAGLRSIDPRALLRFTNRDGGIADPKRGQLVAEHFGAGRFVLGSIVEAGGRMQVSATIYDASGSRQSSVATTVEGEAGVLDAADRLARHILEEAQASPFDARVTEQTTTSLPALKAYLEGERELRASRWEPAHDAFRRATELDTSFALAFYRLAWEDRAAVDRALRHKDRLAEHQRYLVEALAAIYSGDHTTADQRIRQALGVRPDLAESWLMLGDLTWTNSTLIGRPWVDSREAYERALALDPQNGIALSRLVAIAAREQRRAEFDSLTERLLRLDPSSWLASNTRGIRAVVRGDTAELARFIAELRTRPDRDAQLGAGIVTWFTEYDLSPGRRLWRLITEPSHSRGFRVMAHVTLAKIELTNGRRRAAAAELEAVRALDAGSALEHRAYFALTQFQEAPRSELTALRDSLERWDAVAATKSEGDALLAVHRRAHPYFKLYLLGLLSARLGDEAAALRYAGQLERADPSSLPGAFAADGGRFVRAEVAWRRGRPQEALATLEGARFWTKWPGLEAENSNDSPFYSHMHERFARAELLYELGREEEAIPWYRVYVYDLLYTAPAHLRLAQIYERRGERAKAAEHYRQFVELWNDCDPELRPLVDDARQRLARLARLAR